MNAKNRPQMAVYSDGVDNDWNDDFVLDVISPKGFAKDTPVTSNDIRVSTETDDFDSVGDGKTFGSDEIPAIDLVTPNMLSMDSVTDEKASDVMGQVENDEDDWDAEMRLEIGDSSHSGSENSGKAQHYNLQSLLKGSDKKSDDGGSRKNKTSNAISPDKKRQTSLLEFLEEPNEKDLIPSCWQNIPKSGTPFFHLLTPRPITPCTPKFPSFPCEGSVFLDWMDLVISSTSSSSSTTPISLANFFIRMAEVQSNLDSSIMSKMIRNLFSAPFNASTSSSYPTFIHDPKQAAETMLNRISLQVGVIERLLLSGDVALSISRTECLLIILVSILSSPISSCLSPMDEIVHEGGAMENLLNAGLDKSWKICQPCGVFIKHLLFPADQPGSSGVFISLLSSCFRLFNVHSSLIRNILLARKSSLTWLSTCVQSLRIRVVVLEVLFHVQTMTGACLWSNWLNSIDEFDFEKNKKLKEMLSSIIGGSVDIQSPTSQADDDDEDDDWNEESDDDDEEEEPGSLTRRRSKKFTLNNAGIIAGLPCSCGKCCSDRSFSHLLLDITMIMSIAQSARQIDLFPVLEELKGMCVSDAALVSAGLSPLIGQDPSGYLRSISLVCAGAKTSTVTGTNADTEEALVLAPRKENCCQDDCRTRSAGLASSDFCVGVMENVFGAVDYDWPFSSSSSSDVAVSVTKGCGIDWCLLYPSCDVIRVKIISSQPYFLFESLVTTVNCSLVLSKLYLSAGVNVMKMQDKFEVIISRICDGTEFDLTTPRTIIRTDFPKSKRITEAMQNNLSMSEKDLVEFVISTNSRLVMASDSLGTASSVVASLSSVTVSELRAHLSSKCLHEVSESLFLASFCIMSGNVTSVSSSSSSSCCSRSLSSMLSCWFNNQHTDLTVNHVVEWLPSLNAETDSSKYCSLYASNASSSFLFSSFGVCVVQMLSQSSSKLQRHILALPMMELNVLLLNRMKRRSEARKHQKEFAIHCAKMHDVQRAVFHFARVVADSEILEDINEVVFTSRLFASQCLNVGAYESAICILRHCLNFLNTSQVKRTGTAKQLQCQLAIDPLQLHLAKVCLDCGLIDRTILELETLLSSINDRIDSAANSQKRLVASSWLIEAYLKGRDLANASRVIEDVKKRRKVASEETAKSGFARIRDLGTIPEISKSNRSQSLSATSMSMGWAQSFGTGMEGCMPRFSCGYLDADLGEFEARLLVLAGKHVGALQALLPTIASVELKVGNREGPKNGLQELARLYHLRGKLQMSAAALKSQRTSFPLILGTASLWKLLKSELERSGLLSPVHRAAEDDSDLNRPTLDASAHRPNLRSMNSTQINTTPTFCTGKKMKQYSSQADLLWDASRWFRRAYDLYRCIGDEIRMAKVACYLGGSILQSIFVPVALCNVPIDVAQNLDIQITPAKEFIESKESHHVRAPSGPVDQKKIMLEEAEKSTTVAMGIGIRSSSIWLLLHCYLNMAELLQLSERKPESLAYWWEARELFLVLFGDGPTIPVLRCAPLGVVEKICVVLRRLVRFLWCCDQEVINKNILLLDMISLVDLELDRCRQRNDLSMRRVTSLFTDASAVSFSVRHNPENDPRFLTGSPRDDFYQLTQLAHKVQSPSMRNVVSNTSGKSRIHTRMGSASLIPQFDSGDIDNGAFTSVDLLRHLLTEENAWGFRHSSICGALADNNHELIAKYDSRCASDVLLVEEKLFVDSSIMRFMNESQNSESKQGAAELNDETRLSDIHVETGTRNKSIRGREWMPFDSPSRTPRTDYPWSEIIRIHKLHVSSRIIFELLISQQEANARGDSLRSADFNDPEKKSAVRNSEVTPEHSEMDSILNVWRCLNIVLRNISTPTSAWLQEGNSTSYTSEKTSMEENESARQQYDPLGRLSERNKQGLIWIIQSMTHLRQFTKQFRYDTFSYRDIVNRSKLESLDICNKMDADGQFNSRPHLLYERLSNLSYCILIDELVLFVHVGSGIRHVAPFMSSNLTYTRKQQDDLRNRRTSAMDIGDSGISRESIEYMFELINIEEDPKGEAGRLNAMKLLTQRDMKRFSPFFERLVEEYRIRSSQQAGPSSSVSRSAKKSRFMGIFGSKMETVNAPDLKPPIVLCVSKSIQIFPWEDLCEAAMLAQDSPSNRPSSAGGNAPRSMQVPIVRCLGACCLVTCSCDGFAGAPVLGCPAPITVARGLQSLPGKIVSDIETRTRRKTAVCLVESFTQIGLQVSSVLTLVPQLSAKPSNLTPEVEEMYRQISRDVEMNVYPAPTTIAAFGKSNVQSIRSTRLKRVALLDLSAPSIDTGNAMYPACSMLTLIEDMFPSDIVYPDPKSLHLSGARSSSLISHEQIPLASKLQVPFPVLFLSLGDLNAMPMSLVLAMLWRRDLSIIFCPLFCMQEIVKEVITQTDLWCQSPQFSADPKQTVRIQVQAGDVQGTIDAYHVIMDIIRKLRVKFNVPIIVHNV